ncbi:MAG TPA: hypothetical protein VIT62_10120 [Lysobacter sp.]
MNTRSHHAMRPLAAAILALAALSIAPAALAGGHGDGHGNARGCARQFELAQRMDMESFRDYDEETFRAVHDERAVTIFGSGAVRYGIDAIMTALASHFSGREAVWTWTEKYRVVDGCNSAFILYETVYEIPRIGFRQHALTGVTYSHDGHRWLAIADQGTPLP